MSGTKYSAFELKQQLQQRLDRLQQLNRHVNGLRGLTARLGATLDRTPPGLQDSFPDEVAAVRAFLAATKPPQVETFTTDTDAAMVTKAFEEVERLSARAAVLHQTLHAAFGERAGQRGRHLTERWTEVAALLAGEQDVLRLWEPAGQCTRWDQVLVEAQTQIAAQRYAEVEPTLDQLLAELRTHASQAQAWEAKHQRRLYVLKAIQQVCLERGFRPVSSAAAQDANSRGSPIRMVFDTLDKGLIEFSLSLDRIHTHSDIHEGQCFEEFDAVSQSLAELYGVATEFRLASDGSRPDLETARSRGQQTEVTASARPASLHRRV